MAKLTKNRKESLTKFEAEKLYSLKEASDVIKSFSKLKFDSTIDLAVNLGVDPKKADQNVRGIVSLPNGTGKDVKVLALVTPDKEEAKTSQSYIVPSVKVWSWLRPVGGVIPSSLPKKSKNLF